MHSPRSNFEVASLPKLLCTYLEILERQINQQAKEDASQVTGRGGCWRITVAASVSVGDKAELGAGHAKLKLVPACSMPCAPFTKACMAINTAVTGSQVCDVHRCAGSQRH